MNGVEKNQLGGQQPGSPNPPQPGIGGGGYTPPEIKVRTMGDDAKSLEQSGGIEPQAKSFSPRSDGGGMPFSNSPIPEEPIFRPIEPTLPPEPKLPPTPRMGGGMKPPIPVGPPIMPHGKKSNLFTAVIVILLAAAVGAAGYFYGYPWLKSKLATETPPTTIEPGIGDEGEVPVPEATAPAIYSTLFKTLPPKSEDAILDGLELAELKRALGATGDTNTKNQIKEVVMRDSDQNPIGFPKILPVILPEFTTEDLSGYFEDKLTAFVYTDDNGSWPGYIAIVKDGADPAAAKATIAEIENSSTLKNFFLGDMTTTQGFKDGKINNESGRYLIFSQPGAALEYGWFGNYFLVTTNYEAAKKAATLLGF